MGGRSRKRKQKKNTAHEEKWIVISEKMSKTVKNIQIFGHKKNYPSIDQKYPKDQINMYATKHS